MRAIASPRKAAIVQSPLRPATFVSEVARSASPRGRVRDLGVELDAVERRPSSATTANGAPSDTAYTSKARRAGGHPVAVAHPHRLAAALVPHALEAARSSPESRPRRGRTRRMAALDRAAQLLAQRLLAVADAQHRNAARENRLRRARAARLRHGAGPPERITALGFRRSKRFGGPRKGWISQ